jgi:hypothetical protein
MFASHWGGTAWAAPFPASGGLRFARALYYSAPDRDDSSFVKTVCRRRQIVSRYD